MEKSHVEQQLERLRQEELLAKMGKVLIDNIPKPDKQ